MAIQTPNIQGFPDLYNIDVYYDRLKQAFERVAAIRPYKLEVLGYVEEYPLYLLTPEKFYEGKDNILSAGGFHGDEAAGPWGLLEYLETAEPDLLHGSNHSFLPLVNPTGFVNGQRLNIYGENPNRGFIAVPPEMEKGATGNNSTPSAEGKILMKHFIRLHSMARDGFVTQHEDWRLSESFVFANEYRSSPGALPLRLKDVAAKHFSLMPDGGNEYLPDAPVKDGIWMNDEDSSFECLLHYRKVPCTVATETPGQMPPVQRIACNRDMAQAFAAFHKK